MKNKIYLLISILTSYVGMAQIGIGTENPENGIEIEGSIRFRNLEEGDLNVFNREVLMDKEGKLGYLEIENDRSYFVKMIYDEMEDSVVINKTDESKDLLLDIELELLPNTISVFEIHYNVPLYFEVKQKESFYEIPLVSEVGVRLMKKEEGKDNSYVNLVEGNRALSLPVDFENAYPKFEYRDIFIEGMNVQEVVNSGTELKKISYKLMSYSKSNQGVIQYGANGDKGSGVGMMLVKVYHKPYYGNKNKM